MFILKPIHREDIKKNLAWKIPRRVLYPFDIEFISKEMSPKTPKEKESMQKISYFLTIGSLIYIILCTRHDITYAVSVTSRYQF